MTTAEIAIRQRTRRFIDRDGLRANGWCAYCLATKKVIVHHRLPIDKGGGNEPHNLIVLCWRCHRLLHQFLGNRPVMDIGEHIARVVNGHRKSDNFIGHPPLPEVQPPALSASGKRRVAPQQPVALSEAK